MWLCISVPQSPELQACMSPRYPSLTLTVLPHTCLVPTSLVFLTTATRTHLNSYHQVALLSGFLRGLLHGASLPVSGWLGRPFSPGDFISGITDKKPCSLLSLPELIQLLHEPGSSFRGVHPPPGVVSISLAPHSRDIALLIFLR